MKRLYLASLTLLICVLTAKAYEVPGLPDYEAIFKAADLVVLAHVENVILPQKLTDPTEVVLKVQSSLKGDIKKGDLIRVFHDSGKAKARTENGMTVTVSAFRCPAFPRFASGEDVKLYAQWDSKNKRYFVPGHRWKVEQTK